MRNCFLMTVMTAAFVLTGLLVQAQKSNPLRMGVGINAGATAKDPSRLVLGADARFQLGLGNSFSAIGTTGYYHFFKNDKAGDGFGIVPLKAGLKYFPVKNFYVAGEAGVGIGTKENQETSFVYAPSVGLAYANGLDISVKYEDYTKYKGYASQIALRLAYGFKL